MRRRFRGKDLTIEVRNPERVCRGVRALTVDGEPVEGGLVPAERLRQGGRIVAVMGEPS
jgi:hypothetical protein